MPFYAAALSLGPSQSRREIRNRNYEKTKNPCNNFPRFERQSQRPNTLKTKKLITNLIFFFRYLLRASKSFKKSSSKLCCGSVTFWYGSGSADPNLWLTDPDPAPDPASVTFKTLTIYYQESRAFLLFLLDDTVEGFGSVPLTNGSRSGSWRPTTYPDPAPDPQHCLCFQGLNFYLADFVGIILSQSTQEWWIICPKN